MQIYSRELLYNFNKLLQKRRKKKKIKIKRRKKIKRIKKKKKKKEKALFKSLFITLRYQLLAILFEILLWFSKE